MLNVTLNYINQKSKITEEEILKQHTLIQNSLSLLSLRCCFLFYKVYFFLSFRSQEGIELNLNYSKNTRGSAFYPLLGSSAWQAEREEINRIFLSEGREKER